MNGVACSTDQLKEIPITEDTVMTAVISDSYIEKAASVEFANFPTGNRLVMSADANSTDFYKNSISLKITGEAGTDLCARFRMSQQTPRYPLGVHRIPYYAWRSYE